LFACETARAEKPVRLNTDRHIGGVGAKSANRMGVVKAKEGKNAIGSGKLTPVREGK